MGTTDDLTHYGVKGMKWGVTRAANKAAKNSPEVTVTQKKGGTFVQTKGGKKLPASEDAKNAAIGRQKAKASTTDALSNAELRQVVERMNLEAQYSRLAFESDRRSVGQKFISGLLGQKRYNGQKRTFSDPNENAGEQARKAAKQVKDALEKIKAAQAATS